MSRGRTRPREGPVGAGAAPPERGHGYFGRGTRGLRGRRRYERPMENPLQPRTVAAALPGTPSGLSAPSGTACAWSSGRSAERPRSVSVMSWLPNQGPPVRRQSTGGRARPAVPGKRAAQPAPGPAPAEAEAEAYRRRDGVVHGRAGQLEHPGVGRGVRPAGLGDVRVVHVPRQHAHRRRRLARPCPTSAISSRQRVEGLREGRPVLQVRRAGAASPRTAPSARPRSPRHSAAFHASASWTQGGSSQGSEVPIRRWSYDARVASSACSRSQRRLARRRASRGPARPGPGPPGCRPSAAGPGRSRGGSSSAPTAGSASAAAAKARSSVGAVRGCAHGRVQRVGGQLGGREVAEVLVHPVRHQAAEDPLAPPAAWRACRRSQAALVFQSSMTSWSSKIMQLGTVESSQRTSGSSQDSS